MEQATIVRTESVPVDQIQVHPKNARRGNTATIERSLRDHGQYAPVIVHEETGYILKGNHTYRVLRDKLGATHVLATYVRCSESKALAILAVDNKSSDGAGYDDQALAALLEELNDESLLAAAGYREEELDDLLAMLEESDEPELEPTAPGDSVLDGGTGADPEAPASSVSRAEGVVGVKTLKEMGDAYGERATRMLLLYLPLKQYAWAIDKLTELSEKWGIDSNADAILRLIAEQSGEEVPEP